MYFLSHPGIQRLQVVEKESLLGRWLGYLRGNRIPSEKNKMYQQGRLYEGKDRPPGRSSPTEASDL